MPLAVLLLVSALALMTTIVSAAGSAATLTLPTLKGIVNQQVKQVFYTNSIVLREEISIVATLADDAKGPIDNYLIVIPSVVAPKLLHINAIIDEGDAHSQGDPERRLSTARNMPISEVFMANEEIPLGARLFSLSLPRPLTKDNRKITFGVILSYGDMWRAIPAEAAQDAPLVVRFEASPYFYSPYPTLTQKTLIMVVKEHALVALDCPDPKDLTPVKAPVAGIMAGANLYTCGLYVNIPPFQEAHGLVSASVRTAAVPWIKIRRLDRLVEVDLFRSKLHIVEEYEFVHEGHRAQGEAFSRITFIRGAHQAATRGGMNAPETIPMVPLQIPSVAENIQVRDELGLLHGFQNRQPAPMTDGRSHILELAPRFPLHGGWSFAQRLTYDLPLDKYLARVPSSLPGGSLVYRLIMPLFEILHDVPIEDMAVHVRLPSSVRTFGSFPLLTGIEHAIVRRTIDTKAMPLRLGNWKEYSAVFRGLCREQQASMAVHFDYSWWVPYQQPVLLAITVFSLLLVMISLSSTSGNGATTGTGLGLEEVDVEEDPEKILLQLAYAFRERRSLLHGLGPGVSVESMQELARKSAHICAQLTLLSDQSVALPGAALKRLYEEQQVKLDQLLARSTPTVATAVTEEKGAADLDDRILHMESKILATLSAKL